MEARNSTRRFFWTLGEGGGANTVVRNLDHDVARATWTLDARPQPQPAARAVALVQQQRRGGAPVRLALAAEPARPSLNINTAASVQGSGHSQPSRDPAI